VLPGRFVRRGARELFVRRAPVHHPPQRGGGRHAGRALHPLVRGGAAERLARLGRPPGRLEDRGAGHVQLGRRGRVVRGYGARFSVQARGGGGHVAAVGEGAGFGAGLAGAGRSARPRRGDR
jgi:hypothetical protein